MKGTCIINGPPASNGVATGYPSTGPGYPITMPGYPSTGPGYPSTGPGYPITGPGYPSNVSMSGRGGDTG
eukprot:749296-Pyramimonas_sp.AAC.1